MVAGFPPEVGQVARVRDRHWVVADVARSTQPPNVMASAAETPQTLVELSSVEDDGFGEDLSVVWELEPGARVLQTATLPRPTTGRFDDPERLDAFLDAVRWGAIASAASAPGEGASQPGSGMAEDESVLRATILMHLPAGMAVERSVL